MLFSAQGYAELWQAVPCMNSGGITCGVVVGMAVVELLLVGGAVVVVVGDGVVVGGVHTDSSHNNGVHVHPASTVHSLLQPSPLS